MYLFEKSNSNSIEMENTATKEIVVNGKSRQQIGSNIVVLGIGWDRDDLC